MKKFIPILLFCVALATSSACSKDDEGTTRTPEPRFTSAQEQVITTFSKTWVLDSHTQITSENFIPQPILRDMVLIINDDFTYNLTGVNINSRLLPEDGTWSFYENKSNKILLNPVTKYEMVIGIENLSDTNLELKYNFVDQRYAGITYHHNFWLAQ